ncbi:hypothetical protein PJK45_17710 [Mycobacterium kansasii]|uniref:Uncharacterized protein n=3 Tax=Mycobacterium kansasii TaxID=1768 RepID=A0A1V3X2B8_MYCKA|nr:hypothetical protein [Mycobacterium kansasii]EUA03950.1 hypothetical protein I547_3129 [Mycobacterium kansasii 824]AGZ51064.1 hypothetical protein MKAN_12925 [Mycobacterium kansasii ATCC 12478]EUA16319.1 hypothetical protein I545_4204 [Mycobacterium kansasii 662]OOK72986.1 hypothetical protein BZL29_5068 [Mycobacterium kansasii]OOK75793.1 hypothetical protein BZL30_3430 [Mycobacterium kansasii]
MTRRQSEKAESDVEFDPHIAKSRDDEGSYVGLGSADDDFGSGETGAEARSQED